MAFGFPSVKIPSQAPAARGGFNDPRLQGITGHFRDERAKDREEGRAEFDPLFGMNNPAMAEIIEARRKAVFGNDGQADIARAQGIQGINSTMSTGLRNLRGMQATNGVRGGAALGQAMPVLSQANQARGTLESNLALAEQQRKASALSGLESTLTGERAGSLGAQFGWAGLGAQDRSGALQWLQSKDFLNAARNGMGAPGPESAPEKGGYLGKAMKNPLQASMNYFNPLYWYGEAGGAAADKVLGKGTKKKVYDEAAKLDPSSWG